MLRSTKNIITRFSAINYKFQTAAILAVGWILAAGIAGAGVIDLKTTAGDHKLVGTSADGFTGQKVLFGDFNGDGRNDLIVGSRGYSYSGRTNCGVVYVVLTSDTLGSIIDFGTDRPDLVRIFGPEANSQIGNIVGCGDVNHDGAADIVCGIPTASPRGLTSAGEVFVIFGSVEPPDTVDLSSPSEGVTRIEGAALFDKLGESVTVADINDDGFGDIIAGAPFSTTPAGSIAGKVFVVYGSAALDPVVNLAEPGMKIMQVFGAHANDILGKSCYGMDLTGDGIADLVAGAPQESPLGRSFAGAAYIIEGSASPPDTIDLAAGPGSGITRILGPAAGSLTGSNFESGDTDGDGTTDLIVAAPEAAVGGRTAAGSVYVLRRATVRTLRSPAGAGPWPDVIDLQIPPETSTRIDGPAANAKIGMSLAVSDFNLDGFDDVVLGYPLGTLPDPVHPRKESGVTYVLFGRGIFPSAVDLAAEQTGLTLIYGPDPYDHLGNSVAAGRMDADGYDDLFLGANNATVDGLFSVGEAHVLLGSPEITPTALLFYDAAARPGAVTLEWALGDDLDPGDLLVTRSPGPFAGLPSSAIERRSAGRYVLLDTGVEGGETYVYEASLRNDDRQILFRITVTVPGFDGARLDPNTPNPFRHSTTLPFTIPESGRVRVRVYDITGALVAVLADGEFPSGSSSLVWDGRDRSGSRTASGVYFVRLDYAKQTLERKVLIIR